MAGCQTGEPDDEPLDIDTPTDNGAPPVGAVVNHEQTIETIVDRTVLAFRSDEGSFRASYDTHRVKVSDGIVEITPSNHDPKTGVRSDGGVLSIETTALWRGEDLIAGAAESATVLETGRLGIKRGPVVEQLANRENGVEQTWHFAAMPEGEGDLLVQVSATGHEFVTSNTSGLHFKSDQGLGFVYGHATWIDANGRSFPIPVQWRDERIVIEVSDEIIANSAYPAVLDPVISAESALDNPVNGATGAHARNASIAFGGGQYLVVWEDERGSRQSDIYAARISPAGAILDAAGIKVNTAAGVQANPTVAYVGTVFIVAWENYKSPPSNPDIVAARVTAAGAVTSLGNIAATAANEVAPAIAARAGEALLVYRSGDDILGRRFTGGSFSTVINVAVTAAVEKDPVVAANPAGNYMVAYSSGAAGSEDVKGQFVTAGGVLSGAAFDVSAAPGAQLTPTVSLNSGNFAVAWVNSFNGVRLYGTRVSTAGVALDTRTEGMATVAGIQLAPTADTPAEPVIHCVAAQGCLLAWRDRRNLDAASFDLFATKLTTTFTVAVAELALSATVRPQFTPAIATDGSNWFATWHDRREGAVDYVYGARVSFAGAVTDASGLLLVTGNNRETSAVVARTGSAYAVFWTDSRNLTGNDIRFSRYQSNGTLFDTTPRLASGAAYSQIAPSAHQHGANTILVAWADARNGVDRDIYAARINAVEGTVADPAGIAISVGAGEQLIPDVVSSGTVALVVWMDRRDGTFDVRGAILNAAGAVTVPDFLISGAAGDQLSPSVEWDAVNGVFVVVWSDRRSGTSQDIYAARVSTAGAVLDASAVLVNAAANDQLAPDIAAQGNQLLIVWDDRRTDGKGDVYGARVTAAGSLNVLDAAGFAISTATGENNDPKVIAFGGGYMAAWTDGRNLATTGLDVYGDQISTGGVQGTDFVVSNAAGDDLRPGLSEGPGTNPAMITYQRFRADLGADRVYTRRLSAGTTTGQICSSNNQCETGFCADGRCCNTACGGAYNPADCQACAVTRGAQVDGICAPISSAWRCRTYANTFCDRLEFCDGVNPECPPDLGTRQGQVCNTACGAVCPANDASGAPHICPPC